jgi:hydrogenase nickel incorporation protein HypA/HybF
MHELGLCVGIVEATLRRAGDRRVRAVRVRVGGHPVDPEVIGQGFRIAALGTVAEDATVELIQEPALVRCAGCGAEWRVADAPVLPACPRCGGLAVEWLGEERAVLESITVDGEVADDRRD